MTVRSATDYLNFASDRLNSSARIAAFVTAVVTGVYSFTDPNGPEGPARMLENIGESIAHGSNYTGTYVPDSTLLKTVFRTSAIIMAPGMAFAYAFNPPTPTPKP